MGKSDYLRELLKKQQRRIKRFIKNAERRGYIFDDNILPKAPKKPTKASVERLKKITPEKLYKKAKYKTDTGEIITGTKGRQLERKKSAKKGAETRARNKSGLYVSQEEYKTTPTDFNGESYNAEIISEYDTYVYRPPKQTTTILGNALTMMSGSDKFGYVRDEIDEWHYQANWSPYWRGVKENDKNMTERVLIDAISRYGADEVAKRLQENGNNIERIINSILYGSDREQIQFDLVEFSTILNSRPLTQEESAKLTEAVENFSMYEE